MNVRSKSPLTASKTPSEKPEVIQWPVLERDHFLAAGNKELAWKKYCGFLDFSAEEFNSIQTLLLKEQIDIVMRSELGREILGERIPASVEEFRKFTPLTVYSDYRPWFEARNAEKMAEKPLFWAESTDSNGQPVRIPLSLKTARALIDDLITALILSAADKKNDVRLEKFSRLLISLPVKTISEIVNLAIGQRLECNLLIVPAGLNQSDPFLNLSQGIEKGLKTGLDFIVSEPETIARLGENIGYSTIKSHLNSLNLAILYRLFRTWWIGRFRRRPVIARDIWDLQGIVCCLNRSSGQSGRIAGAWGVHPLEAYFTLEGGFIAVQAWNKNGLTLIPYRNFYEFLPVREISGSTAEGEEHPATLLFNELKAGKVYELVLTNFHGGPFLRYRTGDLFKVVALQDAETGINLTQFRPVPAAAADAGPY